MHAAMCCLMMAMAFVSPRFSTAAQVPPRVQHHRALLQDTITDVVTSIVPIGEPLEAAAAASTPSTASQYAPDAPDAAVGEPIPAVEATAAELATVAAASPRVPRAGPRSKRNGIIVPVPGEGLVTAAAVIPAQTAGQVTEVLRLVNNARAQAGQRPVALDGRLINAAMAHSLDQARRGVMSHTGSDGSSFAQRITRTGYKWRWSAENVARGQTSPQSVVTAWLNSPGHRANILNRAAVHMGIGMATATGGPYWTQLFAAPV